MDKSLLLLCSLFISSAFWLHKVVSPRFAATISNPVHTKTRQQKMIKTDSSVIVFNDHSFRLTIHIFDSTTSDQAKNNAVLFFVRQEKNKVKVIFRDSMYCMYPNIDFHDFNNDKIKDILIFNYTGARANPTYHLYLSDTKNRKLIRIKGFENLSNPDLDTANNIITSVGLSGSNYYSFYKIDKKNKLVNLGHSFEENPNDSAQYEKAIRQIRRSHR